jgi:hypothetical protein
VEAVGGVSQGEVCLVGKWCISGDPRNSTERFYDREIADPELSKLPVRKTALVELSIVFRKLDDLAKVLLLVGNARLRPKMLTHYY